MVKTLKQRVNDSFLDSDHEDLTKYCDWLLDSMKSSSQNLRRIVTLILLLVAIFGIIAQSPKTQVSLEGFQVGRNSIVFAFLPALIAYLYFQTILDSVRIDRIGYTYEAAFKRWSRIASDNDFHWWIAPTLPVYWNIGSRPKEAFKSRNDIIETRVNRVLWLAVLLRNTGL